MRFPQLVVYESDRRLGEYLRATAAVNRWALRTPQSASSCLKLLRRGDPAVLVLRLGRDGDKPPVAILERVAWLCPETAAVVVLDTDNPGLANLAWDLGASWVMGPAQPRDQLPEIVAGLMASRSPRGTGTTDQ
jgi:hypothetical protein